MEGGTESGRLQIPAFKKKRKKRHTDNVRHQFKKNLCSHTCLINDMYEDVNTHYDSTLYLSKFRSTTSKLFDLLVFISLATLS